MAMDRRNFVSAGVGAAVPSFLRSGSTASAPAEDIVPTVEALRRQSPGGMVYVEGYHEPRDGGGGHFVWTRTPPVELLDDGTGRAEGGLYVRSREAAGAWIRIVDQSEAINVKWFGAHGDGREDASAPINRAIWVSGYTGWKNVYIPPGKYRLTAPVEITWMSRHIIRGAGVNTTVLEKVRAEGDVAAASRERDEGPRSDACIRAYGKGNLHYNLAIEDMTLHQSVKSASETYGLYIERVSQSRFARLGIAEASTALRARQAWMSSFHEISGRDGGTFLNIGSHDHPCTSLDVTNCYGVRMSGDGFRFKNTFYSALSNCGADRVEGYPYVIERSQGVNLVGCGFEESQNGRGIAFRGSVGTVTGARGLNINAATEVSERVSPLVIEVSEGRSSNVVVTGTRFSALKTGTTEEGEKKYTGVDKDLNSKVIVRGNSQLTLVNTDLPGNASPDPEWSDGDTSQIVIIGRTGDENSPGAGIQILRPPDRVEADAGTRFDRNGMSVEGHRVVSDRKSAIGKISLPSSDDYEAEQIHEIAETLNRVIDVLGTTSDGHGLTAD